MKTYFIFLCLLISGGLASATTQATINQDKPPRLYVKSFNMSQSESGVITFKDFAETYSFNENPNFQDQAAGAYSQEYDFMFYQYDWGYGASWNFTADFSWTNLPLSQLYATEIDITRITCIGGLGPCYEYYSSTNISYLPWSAYVQECSAICMSGSYSTQAPSWSSYPGVASITASFSKQPIMKLQTGGKATSKLRNLFSLSAGAVQKKYTINHYGDWDVSCLFSFRSGLAGTTLTTIASQNITVGSYGALNTNGIKYIILPDNADVDVTPYVAGVESYSFSFGQPQKYHSYFNVYVNMPYPPGTGILGVYPNFMMQGGNIDSGHIWWSLSTDAPSDAINQLISADRSQYLGRQVGYGNTGWSVNFDFYLTVLPATYISGAGKLWNPDPDSNSESIPVMTYQIGWDALINGLGYTGELQNHPGTWDGLENNCVTQTRSVGGIVGVTLPNPSPLFPEPFGLDLYYNSNSY